MTGPPGGAAGVEDQLVDALVEVLDYAGRILLDGPRAGPLYVSDKAELLAGVAARLARVARRAGPEVRMGVVAERLAGRAGDYPAGRLLFPRGGER